MGLNKVKERNSAAFRIIRDEAYGIKGFGQPFKEFGRLARGLLIPHHLIFFLKS